MRYLVTGGAGFIGSNLVEKLLIKGDQVSVIDNLSTGSVLNLNTHQNLHFIEGNILDEVTMESVIMRCDYIIHLAAAVGVFNIVTKPLESTLTNLNGTEIVLKLANKFLKPVLIVSTSEVYGKNNKVPLNEEDDRVLGSPLKTRWSYSECKAVDESLAYFYYLQNKLPVKIVRLFNTVGPRQVGQYGMVVPRFISAAIKNEPLEVFGSGDQIRCFCHISDVIRALLLVINSNDALGQVFNIGNNEQISIIDLAEKVIEITGSKSEIKKIPYSEAYPAGFEDMQRRVPDISKIKNVLGWSPEIGLEQIIKDIADFHRT